MRCRGGCPPVEVDRQPLGPGVEPGQVAAVLRMQHGVLVGVEGHPAPGTLAGRRLGQGLAGEAPAVGLIEADAADEVLGGGDTRGDKQERDVAPEAPLRRD